MSCNGVGLSTPRGSGTSGYVQSNKFQARPKSATAPGSGGAASMRAEEIKKPMSKEIAQHERKRRIESEILLLSKTLAEQGYSVGEIAEKVREARRALESQSDAAGLQSNAKRF